MKRLVAGLLSVTAALVTGAPAYAHTLYPADQDGLNLRRSPSTSAQIAAILGAGEGVKVLGRQGSWYEVRLPGGEQAWAAAWVSRVVFDDEEMEAFVSVSAADVRVRAASDGAVLARVTQGQTLKVLEETAGWYRVRLPDTRQGWLDSRLALLQKVKPPAPPPPPGPAAGVKQVALAVAQAPVLAGRHSHFGWEDTVKQGEKLKYLAAAEGWVQVETARGNRGWLRGAQVQLSDPGADPLKSYRYELDEGTWTIALPGNLRATTPEDGLRLRKEPGLKGGVLGTLPAGTVLQVKAEKDGWLQVALADGRAGWVAKEYTEPRPVLGLGPLVTSASVRTPAPGVRTLELTGRLGGARVLPVEQPQRGIAVLLPDAGGRPASLPVLDGGIDALNLNSSGVFLALSGRPEWRVVHQSAERLVVELRPALTKVTQSVDGTTVVYRMQVTGHVQPRTVAGSQEVVVELPGAVLKVAGAADIAPFVQVEEKDKVLRVRVPSLLPYALKAGPEGSVELHLYQPGLRGKTIVIDPGHGGGDPGATNRALQVLEKDVTLAVSLKLRALLEKEGARVILTRSGDLDPTPRALLEQPPAGVDKGHVDLWYRSDLSNRNRADLYISIHANSGGTGTGTETFFSSLNLNAQRSKELAQLVQQELVAALGRRDRGAKDEIFYVVRTAEAPAVLAELAFLNDVTEAKLLATPAAQQRAAEAIHRAAARFFGVAPPPPAPPPPAPPPPAPAAPAPAAPAPAAPKAPAPQPTKP